MTTFLGQNNSIFSLSAVSKFFQRNHITRYAIFLQKQQWRRSNVAYDSLWAEDRFPQSASLLAPLPVNCRNLGIKVKYWAANGHDSRVPRYHAR